MFSSLVTSIRIDPHRLLGMLLWGIVCGAGLGLLWDVFRITRVFLGVTYASRGVGRLYEKPLPLLRRPVPSAAHAAGRLRIFARETVIFLEDVLFGVMWGVVMTLLIYFTNDGIFRAMAPVGMLCGFLAYYHTIGRLVLTLSQYIVFILRVARCYAIAAILLPPRLLIRLWQKTLGAFLKRKIALARVRRAEQVHHKILRELTARAERGWLAEEAGKYKTKGGWYRATSETHQKNDDRIAERESVSDVDRCVCHHLFCHQNDAEQQASPRKRGVAKADRRGKAKGVRPAV